MGKCIQFRLVCQIIRVQAYFYALQHVLHHAGIAAHWDTLISGIEVIIVKGQPYRQPFDNKSREFLTGASPLFFRVAFDEFFINICAYKGNGLFLQVMWLGNACGAALLLNLCRCFLRCHNTPHPVEGMHIKGQGIQFAVVVGNR